MTTQTLRWLLELSPWSRMNNSGEAGYVANIEQTDGPVLRLTRDPHKAIKFDSRSDANTILNDSAFVNAYGLDHGIEPKEHMFIEGAENEEGL